ncbi:MAG: MFS transporter [Bryobacteraceae bacterium]|nr:MFS transporter [Bryobacteraceae bacterium]
MSDKWRTLMVLFAAELLAMGVWFSASAVAPQLAARLALNDGGKAWLTMAVQGGFVAGALASAVLNLADRIAAHRLFAITALLAAGCTAWIPFRADFPAVLALRFLTGFFLAGVYPVGMKIVATWTTADRGLGIGLLVGALTLGSAGPQLLNVAGGGDWRLVLWVAAGFAAAGGMLAAAFVREGPGRMAPRTFRWDYVLEVFRNRDLRLANLGYLGHMWELYAMWSWIAWYLAAPAGATAGRIAFLAIASGALGSVAAGVLADRIGRARVTIYSMAVSGACAAGIGLFYHAGPFWLGLVAVIWGFAIVADSAQFSAVVSERCDPKFSGTALTLQTCLGFLLTMATIRMVPAAERLVGTQWSFAFLALGPAAGIWAMSRLGRESKD